MQTHLLPLAASGGIVIVIFAVIFVLVIAFGFYSRMGSAINQRPQGTDRSGAPGVGAGKSRISSAEDETEGVPDTHGTK